MLCPTWESHTAVLLLCGIATAPEHACSEPRNDVVSLRSLLFIEEQQKHSGNDHNAQYDRRGREARVIKI